MLPQEAGLVRRLTEVDNPTDLNQGKKVPKVVFGSAYVGVHTPL